MSVSLVGRRTLGALLEGIARMMATGEIRLRDEIRVDRNDGGFCTSRVDRLEAEGDFHLDDDRVLILWLQRADDGTP